MKFEESTLLNNFCLEAKTTGMLIDPQEVVNFSRVLVAGTSDFLQLVKAKSDPVAMIFEDLKGNILLAAIVSYEANEDKTMPGNWNYYWTFDKDDVKDIKTYSINSSQIFTTFSTRAYDLYKMSFNTSAFFAQLAVLFATHMGDFLDQNAIEGEEFVVELEGYFRASVTVENGVKVKSFVPDGAMKRLIKDDESASTDVA